MTKEPLFQENWVVFVADFVGWVAMVDLETRPAIKNTGQGVCLARYPCDEEHLKCGLVGKVGFARH